jgi:hypothetical protein
MPMISDFKKQTPSTIYRFLSELGNREDVYSVSLDGAFPLLNGYCVYLYGYEEEMVLLLVDPVQEGTKEWAGLVLADPDEESVFMNFTNDALRKSYTNRVSPVWQLYQTAHTMWDFFYHDTEHPIQVHAVVLTNSRILNYRNLNEAISVQCVDIGMTVLHQCYAFCDLWLSQNLPLNGDFLLPGGIYYHIYEDHVATQRPEVDDDDEEDVDIKWLLDNMDEDSGGEAEKEDSEDETEMLNIGDPKRLAVHRAKLAFMRRRQE